MHIESDQRDSSLSISISYKADKMGLQSKRMDINTVLNPADTENEENSYTTSYRSVKEETAFVSYGLPFQQKAVPVEIGGYAHAYPTPANSPVQTASVPTHGPQHGSLPSMNHILYYPSPALSHSSLSPSVASPQLSTYGPLRSHRPRQLDTNYHLAALTSITRQPQSAGYRSPHQCSHRALRSERDCLHRSTSAITSIALPTYLETTKSTLAPPKKRKAHSNEAYKREYVHWVRYHHIDLAGGWKPVATRFNIKYPERAGRSDGALSSRFYRDNLIPEIDVWGRIVYENGKMKMRNVHVRQKDKGGNINCPWTFIERHPWAALTYDWVLPEHKAEAARIIADIERKSPEQYTRRQQYSVAIREYEIMKEASRQSKHGQPFSGPLSDCEQKMEFVLSPSQETSDDEEESMEDEQLYKEAVERSRIN